MSDYISRGELLELYTLDGPINETGVVPLPVIRQNIMDMSAADVAPVRHGRWLTTDAYPHRLYCSACYKTYAKNMKWVDELELPIKFCPECGARMDGEEDRHD